MNITDLLLTIENVRGSYKKFREGYAVPGVTFPTHYGYIQGYKSEDGKDLDVYLGNGDLHGYIKMERPTFPDGVETKTFVYTSEEELLAIEEAYKPVIVEIKQMEESEFMDYIQNFKSNTNGDLIYTNLLSENHEKLIEFYTNVVGLQPVAPDEDPAKEKWYGYKTGKAGFAIEPMSNRDKYQFEYKKGNPTLIQLKVDTFEALTAWTERLEAADVVIGQRMRESSYGIFTTFVDPDGNVIELLHVPSN